MWSLSRSVKDRHAGALGRHLVRESENVLAGRYVIYLQSRGIPVPEWAWLNMLTNAPADLLLDQAYGGKQIRSSSFATAPWQEAMTLLARELLATADRAGCSVATVQRSLLFDPGLEEGSSSSHGGPQALVEAVLRCLERFRDSSHP